MFKGFSRAWCLYGGDGLIMNIFNLFKPKKKEIKKESYDQRFKWNPYYKGNKVTLTGKWKLVEKYGYTGHFMEIEIIGIDNKRRYILEYSVSIKPDPVETIFECTNEH